jgi:hypothetical protein
MPPTRRTSLPARLAAVLLLASLLAACGGGDGTDQEVASLGDATTRDTAADDDSGGGADGDVSDAEAEEAMLEFAACMRENGVDMPDPELDGGGGAIAIGPDGAAPDREAFEQADEACRHLMEDVMGAPEEMTPEEQAEMEDQALAFAQCMRDNGVDMPDPQFDGDGRVTQELAAIDPDDESFQDAQDACAEEMGGAGGPGFRIGPGGPPGGETGPATDEQVEAAP